MILMICWRSLVLQTAHQLELGVVTAAGAISTAVARFSITVATTANGCRNFVGGFGGCCTSIGCVTSGFGTRFRCFCSTICGAISIRSFLATTCGQRQQEQGKGEGAK
jgi:hypothetical protein